MKEILDKEVLKAIRENRKMTQAEFAKKIGYSEDYISRIERGSRPVTDEFTKNLIYALDLEKAYREACSNYCEIQEIVRRKPYFPKWGWVCLILSILFFVLVF